MTQDGADPHHRDPLAHLQVTMPTFPRCTASLHQLARRCCDGRWVALGGGGYNTDVVPRAWAMLFAEMIGAELEPPASRPTGWRRPSNAAVSV